MQNQALHRRNTQSGNALWFILVTIALLTALTLTMTSNSSKTASNLSDENRRLLAEQVLRTMSSVGSTVGRLMSLNGCSETEISFESTLTGTTYVNASAPADKHCHVFDPAGGGLAETTIPVGVFVGSPNWVYSGNNSVNGVGPEYSVNGSCSSNCSELIMAASDVDEGVCFQVNKLLKVNTDAIPTESNNVGFGTFTGTYGAGTAATARISEATGNSGSRLYGVKAGCYVANSRYDIYYALIVR